jgi:hypothetical protein
LVRRSLFGLLYQPRMIHDDECGAIGGMIIGRGKPKYSEKPLRVPLYPPQISQALTWARIREAGDKPRDLWYGLEPCVTVFEFPSVASVPEVYNVTVCSTVYHRRWSRIDEVQRFGRTRQQCSPCVCGQGLRRADDVRAEIRNEHHPNATPGTSALHFSVSDSNRIVLRHIWRPVFTLPFRAPPPRHITALEHGIALLFECGCANLRQICEHIHGDTLCK